MLELAESSVKLRVPVGEVRGISGVRYYCACICVHDAVQCSGARNTQIRIVSTMSTNSCEHTDLTTGPFAITVVLKLNGPSAVESLQPFCVGVDSAGPGLKLNEGLVGLRRSPFPGSSDPLLGNVSLSGDKASRSIATPELICGAY
jgi:hypothetical protein